MTSLISDLSHVFLPLTIVIATTSVFGFLGNAMAFYIFNFRYPSSGFNVLMASLAVYDMAACAIHMPLDIATFFDIGHVRSYLCKITCFQLAFTAIGAALILMSIAVVRFIGIYRPLGSFFSTRSAIYVIVISILASSGIALPITFLFGDGELTTDANVTVHICAVESRFMLTEGPIAYYFILASLYVITFIGHTCLYIKSMAILWSRRHTFVAMKGKKNVVMLSPAPIRNRNRFQPILVEPSCSPLSVRSVEAGRRFDAVPSGRIEQRTVSFQTDNSAEEREMEIRHGTETHQNVNSRDLESSGGSNLGALPRINQERISSPKPLPRTKFANGSAKTTTTPDTSSVNQNSYRILAVVVAISMTYFLSYAPHFGVMFYLFTHDKAVFTSSAQSLVCELLMRSFFLNNILDPVIYGLLSKDFRQEVKRILFSCSKSKS